MEEYKYLLNGQMVYLVQAVAGGFLVSDVYEDDECGLCSDEEHSYVVKKVFKEPPVIKFSADIEKQKAELASLEEKKSNVRSELLKISAEHIEAKSLITERLDILKKHDQLALLEDFINGKITHYVIDKSYMGLEIMEFTSKENHTGFDHKTIRLLSLFGHSAGNLKWGLSEYGSACNNERTVMPCTSYEMALRKLQELLTKKEDGSGHDDVNIRTAKKYGLTLSKAYTDGIHAEKRTTLANRLKKQRQDTAETKKELEEFDAKDTK